MKIKKGQIWQHHNGILYKVIGIANIEHNNFKYPPCVVYESLSKENLWVKQVNNFLSHMTYIGES